MVKLRENLNITKPDAIDEIYNIHFKFTKGKFLNSWHCENVIAWDTESSNGFLLPGSSIVVGFDQKMYDRGVLKTHGVDPKTIDHDDPDVKYMELIDKCTPVGLMYLWQVAVEDGVGGIKAFMGRTWESFNEFIDKLATEMRRQMAFGFDCVDRAYEECEAMICDAKCYAKIFAHNLGHDWQFLRTLYDDAFACSRRKGGNVFARKARKPMKANMNECKVNWEYRDTLVYSQKSLKAWAHDCPACPLEKLEDFDYLTIKTPDDVLTDEEIHYGLNDVLIIVYCMVNERNFYGTLEELPLTQTGKVRKVIQRDVCAANPYWAYNCAYQTKNYTLDEYKKRIMLSQGGYTHACDIHSGEVGDCRCFDFASSYPSALANGKYATTGYEPCDVSEFDDLAAQDVEDPDFRWFAKIKLTKVHSVLAHNYWSSSKCVDMDGICCDNGRIYSAKSMTIYAMDLDWFTFKQAYAWESMEVLELQKGKAEYLPVEMVETVLRYYGKKTLLKGDDSRISEYIESKEFINSIYGCFVYKQAGDEIFFNQDGWKVKSLDDGGTEMFYKLMKQVSDETAFGFFDLGMTCSAIARKRIWDFILHFDDSVWYVDTDSIKGEFSDADIDWINNYNKWIEDRENRVAADLGIDPDLFAPLTAKGKKKRLGIMEREEDCKFKTLGAKRYIAEHDGEIECTIAGLPKWAGKAKIKTFDDFSNETLWTTEESGKVCCYYNDNQPKTVWTGRDGKEYISEDKFGVCLKPVTFDLSMSGEFISFLQLLACGVIDKNNPYFNDTPQLLMK